MIAIVTPEQRMQRAAVHAFEVYGKVRDDDVPSAIRRCIQAGQRPEMVAQAFGLSVDEVRFAARAVS